MSNLIAGLLNIADDILGIRDQIGAAIHPVYRVTRVWSGEFPGDGTATDVVTQIVPTPGIVNLDHDFESTKGGNYEQGDLLLKGISKQSYSLESSVNNISGAANIEKFYLINDKIYHVISVKENYISWDVQVRKISNQTRY